MIHSIWGIAGTLPWETGALDGNIGSPAMGNLGTEFFPAYPVIGCHDAEAGKFYDFLGTRTHMEAI